MERYLSEQFTDLARAEFERQSGILGQSLNYNEKNLEQIVNASFKNAEWSHRLWANQTALRAELDKLLVRSILQGKNPRVMARELRNAVDKMAEELRKTFDASIYNTERLMRTETARIQTDVFIDSMKQANIEQYEWIAEPDACEYCAELDGKIFDVAKMEIGVNAVPKHPHCKCSQAAYVDREAFEAELTARGL